MDDYIPLTSETLNSKSNPNGIYHIGGIPVEFPHEPGESELELMSRVISTLDRAHKQDHSHVLLESSTGTGKTLSLLCSALAWQRNFQSTNLEADFEEAALDQIDHGGGEPSSNLPSEIPVPDPSAKDNGNQKKKSIRQIPTIFYASRTHAQISQVIREYRKTSYRVPMVVLGSRKHYCTNKDVSGRENIDEGNLLMKSEPGDQGCFQFRNVNKVISHHSLQREGCNEAHDIEDLVKVGRAVKGCSYFAARTMAQDAQLVFCPYSYILNPTIRRAMDVDLKRSIVILDEAHDIEDMAREAASVDIEEDALDGLQRELEQLRLANSSMYAPLHDMIEGLISWLGRRTQMLVNQGFQHYSSCWTGEKATGELQEAGISQQFFPILQECAIKAIKAASDSETDVTTHLSGMSVVVLEGLCSSLCYFFMENGSHAHDYQLVLRRYIKRESGSNSGKLTQCFSLWCMNPAVSFSEIANLSTSVILTSGTPSPMNPFSSELGVKFETCMEAPHIINVESQGGYAFLPVFRGKTRMMMIYTIPLIAILVAFMIGRDKDSFSAEVTETFRVDHHMTYRVDYYIDDLTFEVYACELVLITYTALFVMFWYLVATSYVYYRCRSVRRVLTLFWRLRKEWASMTIELASFAIIVIGIFSEDTTLLVECSTLRNVWLVLLGALNFIITSEELESVSRPYELEDPREIPKNLLNIERMKKWLVNIHLFGSTAACWCSLHHIYHFHWLIEVCCHYVPSLLSIFLTSVELFKGYNSQKEKVMINKM